jgi:hypothetical protein
MFKQNTITQYLCVCSNKLIYTYNIYIYNNDTKNMLYYNILWMFLDARYGPHMIDPFFHTHVKCGCFGQTRDDNHYLSSIHHCAHTHGESHFRHLFMCFFIKPLLISIINLKFRDVDVYMFIDIYIYILCR